MSSSTPRSPPAPGLIQRVTQGGQSRLQVVDKPDPQQLETIKMWRQRAEADWQDGHRGWQVVMEPLVSQHAGGGVGGRAGWA